jgi:lactoylglutathione lyase
VDDLGLRVSGRLTYGFSDPALTGWLEGVRWALDLAVPVALEPEFRGACLTGAAEARGRTYGYKLALAALRALQNPIIRKRLVPAGLRRLLWQGSPAPRRKRGGKGGETDMGLRLELFVKDTAASADFYTRVLGFEERGRNGTYIGLRRGDVRIALNAWDELSAHHYFRQGEPHPLKGAGVEIVLEADDVEAVYARVQESGYPLSSPLTRQPWGLTDFRVADPDGYYWRITSVR